MDCFLFVVFMSLFIVANSNHVQSSNKTTMASNRPYHMYSNSSIIHQLSRRSLVATEGHFSTPPTTPCSEHNITGDADLHPDKVKMVSTLQSPSSSPNATEGLNRSRREAVNGSVPFNRRNETSPEALGAANGMNVTLQGPVYMAWKANGSYGLNQSEPQPEMSNTTHQSLVKLDIVSIYNGSVSFEKDNTSRLSTGPPAVIRPVNESGHGVYSHPRPEQSQTSYGNNGQLQPQHREPVHPKYVRSVSSFFGYNSSHVNAAEANNTNTRTRRAILDFDPISMFKNMSTGFIRTIEKIVNITEAPEESLTVTAVAEAESPNITVYSEHRMRRATGNGNGTVVMVTAPGNSSYNSSSTHNATVASNATANHRNESTPVDFYIVNGTIASTHRPGYIGMAAPQAPEYVPVPAGGRPNAGSFPYTRPSGNAPNLGKANGQTDFYLRPLQQRPQYPTQQQHTPDCEHLSANHQH